MLGDFGKALIFLTSLVGTALVGLFLYFYGSHCFLVILEQTAAEEDEVTWPDEPITDWVGKGIYLGWLILIWCAPLWFIFQIVVREPQEFAINLFFLLGVIWLIFPISLLSSLSAPSRWMILHGKTILGLFSHFFAALLTYIVSAGLIGLGFWLWHFAIMQSQTWPLLAAALAMSSILLIYARLLGRLGWLISLAPKNKRKKALKRPPKPRGISDDEEMDFAPEPEASGSIALGDPLEDLQELTAADILSSDLPEEVDDWASPPKPYVLMSEDQATTSWKNRKKTPLDEDPGSYGLLPQEANPLPPPVFEPGSSLPPAIDLGPGEATTLPPSLKKASEDHLEEPEIVITKKLNPLTALWAGVYNFPFTSSGLRALVYLTLLSFFQTLLLRIMLDNWPF